jgi:translation elongation factor Ts
MSAAQVKELRERTGAGILDCKKALEEANGDIEKAVDILRQKGIAKAQKKQSRIAAEGLTAIYEKENKAVILEVNSETDFVSKNDKFKDLIANIGNTVLNSNAKTLEEAMELKYNDGTINDYIIAETAVIGEKLSFRRFELVEKADDENFGIYIHLGGKISTLAVVKGGNKALAKSLAMQITAMNPKYMTEEEVPEEVKAREMSVIKEQIANEKKDVTAEVAEKMANGRLNKFFKEICLLDQEYIDDSKKNVKTFLEENKMEVLSYIRYEVGEGIEKKVDNFAEEVMSQING